MNVPMRGVTLACMRHGTANPKLAARVRRVFALLQRFEPFEVGADTQWHGPHFVASRREWWPARFLLYRDELYVTLELGWSRSQLAWRVGTDAVEIDGSDSFTSGSREPESTWHEAMKQFERRLASALRDPERYARRLERDFPIGSRRGLLVRARSWPKGMRAWLSAKGEERLRAALDRAERAPSLPELAPRRYFEIAAIAYDAAVPKLRRLAPLDKYLKAADKRDGGLLALPTDDSEAFARWFRSPAWSGTHPWEIVYSMFDGVVLGPWERDGGWRFGLSAGHLGQAEAVAKMARALGEQGVPFEWHQAEEMIAALRGRDEIEIGPFSMQLSLAELRRQNRAAVKDVRWDPLPVLKPRREAVIPRVGRARPTGDLSLAPAPRTRRLHAPPRTHGRSKSP
ncbi:MAG: hypothetical protein HZA53_15100 [Planctomycetes bacterium]|nr:hypothetical protein [Planctomycetota bacterium]